jgi:hypothetical protein
LLTRTQEQSPTKVQWVGNRSLPGVRPTCPASLVRHRSTLLRPFRAGMLGAFGQVQVDALTRVGSPVRRGTVVDCYMAQQSSIPGIGANDFSRQSPIVHLVALCLFIEHGIEGRGTFLRLALLLERRPNFRALGPGHDRGQLGVGSPFLEMRNWAMRTSTRAAPKPEHRRYGENGRTSTQNPEPRHQVAVTRLDVHHTVGGSHAERPIKGSDRSGSARQRPAEGDSAVTTTNTLEAAPSTSSTTWTAHGPRPTVARRCS